MKSTMAENNLFHFAQGSSLAMTMPLFHCAHEQPEDTGTADCFPRVLFNAYFRKYFIHSITFLESDTSSIQPGTMGTP